MLLLAGFGRRISGGCKSMKIACYLALIHVSLASSCAQPVSERRTGGAVAAEEPQEPIAVLPGIHAFTANAEAFTGKRIGITANHTAVIGSTHLVDTLIASGAEVRRIFAPEHGFRGNLADGATVRDGRDGETGLPVVSLYGKNKKPAAEHLEDLDLMVFDIQDVGARFYTYISSLHYVMEACAESDVPVVVLDRPNPHRHYTDGPVLRADFSSFVGMHPVPAVYGLTIGEYAGMINGEGWLKGGVKCDLEVYPCENYTASVIYELPVPPSPNLPDMTAVYLYPSLCFFEGTVVSVGRGTSHPFQMIGEPGNRGGDFEFVPKPIPGVSDHPPHEGMTCRGYLLRDRIDPAAPPDSMNMEWLVRMYTETKDPSAFFLKSGFIDKLAGTDRLRKDVIAGKSAAEIRASWQDDLEAFEKIRTRYTIYSE